MRGRLPRGGRPAPGQYLASLLAGLPGDPDGPCLAPGADPDPHVLEDFNHG